MIFFTGSSSLNVMKQKPRLLLVLLSMGSSMASTWRIWIIKWKNKNKIKSYVYKSMPVQLILLSINVQSIQSQSKKYTSPNVPKYSLIFSSGVSGDKPPTNIFFTGSFVFIAFALFGSITLPFNLCSFCSITCSRNNQSKMLRLVRSSKCCPSLWQKSRINASFCNTQPKHGKSTTGKDQLQGNHHLHCP